jgi:16S rRNA (guanine527-N7)-methyltransferase
MDPPTLARVLTDLGLDPTPGLLDRIEQLAAGLDEWAPKLNLSNITGHDLVLVRHVLDALLLTRVVPRPGRLIDVGTGPGVPALPLALVWPETEIVTVDSRRKSGWLVEHLARDLGLANVKQLCERAESPVTLSRYSCWADVVCSRGLAKPRRAIDLCMPLARPGGTVAALTGPEVDEMELRPDERVATEVIPDAGWQRRILLAVRTSEDC